MFVCVWVGDRVILKTEKMVLDASLLNTEDYKVQVKGGNPEKEWCPLLHLSVVPIGKKVFALSLTKVANFTYIYIYI